MRLDEDTSELRGALAQENLLEPVREDTFDLWVRWDVASLIEGTTGGILSAEQIDAEREALTYAGVGSSFLSSRRDPDGRTGQRFFLLHDGARAGTLQIARNTYGSGVVRLASLYVTPEHRQTGLAARALRQVFERALSHGLLSIQLGAIWTWQDALRFYLRRGLWVRNWKHDLQLAWDVRLGEHRVQIAESQAAFSVPVDGAWQVILRAESRGECLGWTTVELPPRALAAEWEPLREAAANTLALHLSARGWPLIRSEEAWAQRTRHADSGAPEGLAYKIAIFEALARERGWRVQTPVIPGLASRTP